MRYLCVHCDKAFEHDEEGKKPRCPSCMRVNGVEKVAAQAKPTAGRPPWLLWAVGGAVVAAGVGYAFWASNAPDVVGDEVPVRPLDQNGVAGHLRRQGVEARELAQLLVPSEAVAAWARRTAGDASGAEARARAVQQAIRERAQRGAFQRWSLGVPRESPPATSDQVLTRLSEDRARHKLYPLEVAALMASALRALDVDAMVAEAIRFPGDRSPPDASGQVGYFVVAVYPNGAGEGEPTYFDPYAGRTNAPEEARVLTDLQAIGAALGLKALHLLSRESDAERALEAVGQALRLDARSPTLRATRAAILLVAGHVDEGVRELQAARQLRTDAPRRNLLAGIYLAPSPFQDLDTASQEVSQALEEYPEFAPGRATLAAIHLARQETDEARTELDEAQRLDPDLHILPQLWASYYVVTGDVDRAIEHARESIARNPADVQAHLLAARIYRQASRYELMRREAHEVMDRTPPARRAEMRNVIHQLLGPTALEPLPSDDAEDDEELEAALEDDEELDDGEEGSGSLTLDSPLLGGAPPTTGRPSLVGGGRPSLLGNESLGGGGLQLGGGSAPSSGGNLRLNLGE